MGTMAYLFFKNRYDQMTQELVFWYAFIRQVSSSRCCQLLTSSRLLQICYWYII